MSLRGGGVSRRIISDSKGRFVFADLPAVDRYYLEASKPGYVADGLARPGRLLPEAPFPLADAEWIADANFVMQRLSAISGTVIDERGEPVVNVPVRVLTRIPVAGTMQLASGPAARTDDRGVYRVAWASRRVLFRSCPVRSVGRAADHLRSRPPLVCLH